METFLIKALQLVLSLSILVIVHELGHFILARVFKIRVDKFYLFFDVGFALFRYKPKNSHTEFGVGWLPLGGYCQIAGMVDESVYNEQDIKPAESWELRSRPPWQRLLVMIAGVVFNMLLAFFIYAMVLFQWNDTYLPLKNVKMGMEFSQAAKNAGFQDGDILLRADDKELERFGVRTLMDVADAEFVTVIRDGKEIKLPMSNDLMKNLLRDKEGFATYRFPTVIQETAVGSNAEKAGLLPGDSIISVNGTATSVFTELKRKLEENKGKEISLEVVRKGALLTLPVQVDSVGLLGFYPKAIGSFYDIITVNYGFLESFPAGIKRGIQELKDYVAQFKYVFTKEGATSIGGFAAMGQLFPPVWDWYSFWIMTAFLSVILAFMNIIPIPGLDGGHVLFLLYEMITGRKPSPKFVEYAQIAGLLFLLALVIYANGLDILRAIIK
ncbi:MAG: RIP metalloprotease RseP [Dysgonamonadaceae bacterium]|jgi:regulator of sigma E protease|nr:RIP metalloprotease RseP [Dysgonamonadaceae bacterium]MDD3309303.1 RIP metalloprotease RseP [Dysgonamonadaceae bacterium]MDD3900629.1 RIP metalloprotease RseP [Dysgonamonadaceae bacterium]MDD4399089.1 RIP metalloprotease RseP [Dysgonamonadaceae bacterium]